MLDLSRVFIPSDIWPLNKSKIVFDFDIYFLSDVKAVLLADKIFFCHEKDQKYSLVSVDNKPPVVFLRKSFARGVATGIVSSSNISIDAL